MIPKMRIVDARSESLGPRAVGSQTSRPSRSTAPPQRTTRTSGRRAMTFGMGRTSSAACQVDTDSSEVRATPFRRRSSATTITPATIGSVSAGLDAFQPMPASSTPRATAAAATAAKSVIPPRTRAARMRNRKPKVAAEPPIGRPTTPARSQAPVKARTAATIQTTVWIRFTGMPSSAARSARSADARTAMPTSVRCRKNASATIISGAMMSAARSSALSTIGSIVRWASNGDVEGQRRRRGRSRSAAATGPPRRGGWPARSSPRSGSAGAR